VEELAKLIKDKNKIENEIAEIIGRPSLIGHVGEYIASEIFDIELNLSATTKGMDGLFKSGHLKDKTANVKFYGKRENKLDINCKHFPDYYLVLTGPKSSANSSRSTTRPWFISNVYLFNTNELLNDLENRNVNIGIATSVISSLWDDAEIYPNQINKTIPLSKEQMYQLRLFDQN